MAANASTRLRRWLIWRLACERQGHAALPGDPGPLAAELATLPAAALLAEIRRQRLVSVLAADLAWLGSDPALDRFAAGLRRLAAREMRATLALQHLTCRVASLFEQAGQPLLVLKGIPLALQICGSAIARGSGDLDLLVPGQQLPAAVALLESAGFERPPGRFPRNLEGFWGRYSRWATNELLLMRQGPVGMELVDLHWSLAPVRHPLPAFSHLWSRRQRLVLQGQSLFTLGLGDALLFAAAHAAKEDWYTMRHLVDFDRLARQLHAGERQALRRHRLVRLSAGVAHAHLGGPELLTLCDPNSQDLQRALAICRKAQREVVRTPRAPGPWSLRGWLTTLQRQAGVSRHPIDWLRVVLAYTLLPGAFNDPVSGRDRGLLGMLLARWQRWRQRRGERLRRSSPASARSGAAPEA